MLPLAIFATDCSRKWKPTLPCAWKKRILRIPLKVSGRGALHLSILIENMRRELFEFKYPVQM